MDIIIIIIRLCLSYQDLQIHQKEIILLFPVINKRCITGIETSTFAWLFWRSWLKKTAELNQWVERQITWVDPSELPAWLRTGGENKQPFLWLTKPISPTDRINKTTARFGDQSLVNSFSLLSSRNRFTTTPQRGGSFGVWPSCQGMRVDVKSWESSNDAIQEMGMDLKWLTWASVLAACSEPANLFLLIVTFYRDAQHKCRLLNTAIASPPPPQLRCTCHRVVRLNWAETLKSVHMETSEESLRFIYRIKVSVPFL